MTSLINHVEGNVLVVELARADRGNALNRELQRELAETWREFEGADDLRVAVLCGAKQVFSIGHDVAELAANPSLSPVPADEMFPLHGGKPVIAAIEGPCYGLGFELALSCDLRIIAEGAMCGFADPNLFVPYRMGTVLLPRMTFAGKSLELILSGHILGAREMAAARLASEVTERGMAAARATALACEMAVRFTQPGAFRKREIWRLSGLPLPTAMQLARMPRDPR